MSGLRYSQPAGSIAAIHSEINAIPSGFNTREGSSGIFIIGSSDCIRNTMML